jgi:hypothetical protein
MRLGTVMLTSAILLVESAKMPVLAANGLIPPPQEMRKLSGQLDPAQLKRILLGPGTGPGDEQSIREMLDAGREFPALSLSEVRRDGGRRVSGGEIWLGDPRGAPEILEMLVRNGAALPEDRGPEAYCLLVLPDRVIIAGATPAARYYGWRTLAQWLELGHRECTAIRDWPAFALRGVTDDISRGQVSTPENFKAIIQRLAQLKMNTYMPYLEDMFTFRSYPQIGQGRGAWTPELAQELQDYAERYHVQIIPIFQTLGHYENLLLQPQFIHLAEFPGAASLNVSCEATYEFLETVLSEIVPVFRSPYFHIGADESWDVGKGATRERAQKLGVGKVHVEHYKRVNEIVRRYGKTTMMYADIVLQHPEILEELPRDIVLFDWHYDPQLRYPSVEVLRRAGFRFVVSPGIQNWAMIFPNLSSAMANILHLSLRGLQAGAFGSLTSNWGDYGGANLRELNWFGYAWAAECAWNPQAASPSDFAQRFTRLAFGAEIPEIPACFALLGQGAELTHYPDLWRHPFYQIRSSQEEQRLLRKRFVLPLIAASVESLLDVSSNRVRRNRDQLDYLRHSARTFRWIGERADLSLTVERLRRGIQDSSDAAMLTNLANRCDLLAEQLNALRQEYTALWLRTNLEANLALVLELFDRQETYLRAAAEGLRRGQVPPRAELSSNFVTAEGRGKNKNNIYARKVFHLDRPVQRALLQAIGNDHLRVFLNGELIGEVYARPSLSIRVEKERVQAWDVTGRLRPGSNTLAFEAISYDPEEPASGNLYLWVKLQDGSTAVVRTDQTWRASRKGEEGWVMPEFNDRGWKPARIANVRWRICEPDFERNLPSRIEWWE